MTNSETVTLSPEQAENTALEQQECCGTIREAAYYKWEAAGCPCSDGVDFWLQAEAEATNGASQEGD